MLLVKNLNETLLCSSTMGSLIYRDLSAVVTVPTSLFPSASVYALYRSAAVSALVNALVWFTFPDLSQETRAQTKAPTWGKVSWQQPWLWSWFMP